MKKRSNKYNFSFCDLIIFLCYI